MKTFQDLGLSKPALDAIEALGFINPTPIQQEVIPAMLAESQDIIALAHTGTGKTAAFGLPLIELIDTTTKKPQALILAPTRELCVQIENDLKLLLKTLGISIQWQFMAALISATKLTVSEEECRL